jgi:hypothetical protein
MMFYKYASIIALSSGLMGTLAISSANAQMADSCGASFMILPDGNCLSLDYLPVLAGSRANLAEANDIYQRQYNANLQLEILYNRYPAYVSETEAERDARYESLAETSIFRDEVADSNQRIEDDLYPLHLQAMHLVGEAFRHTPSWESTNN